MTGRLKLFLSGLLAAVTVLWSGAACADFVVAPGRMDVAMDTRHGVLYISGWNQLRRYDLATRSYLTPIMTGGTTTGLDISPDGKTLAVGNLQHTDAWAFVDLVDLDSLAVTRVPFAIGSADGGSYSVAFDAQGKLLVSIGFEGSGWTQLRKINPITRKTVQIGGVTQNIMLAASGDRSVIGVVESNISDGRWGVYHAGDTSYVSQHQYYDPVTGGTGWFNFEVGVSRDGAQIAIPTYGGTYVGTAERVDPVIGTYAGKAPIGVAYSPVADRAYFPFAGTQYIAEYDTKTLTQLRVIPVPATFDWTGNFAYVEGRTKVSADGKYLFSTLNGGVFYTALPAPAAAP